MSRTSLSVSIDPNEGDKLPRIRSNRDWSACRAWSRVGIPNIGPDGSSGASCTAPRKIANALGLSLSRSAKASGDSPSSKAASIICFNFAFTSSCINGPPSAKATMPPPDIFCILPAGS